MISNKRRRELYAMHKAENPEWIARRRQGTKDWIDKHPEMRKVYRERWESKVGREQLRASVNARSKARRQFPWQKTYTAIHNRLRRSKNTGKAGIKYRCYVGIEMHMTPSDLKMLWERDSGAKLKSPSIDRIDSNGHYTVDNCQYIELSANLSKPKLRPHEKNIKKLN